MRYDIEIQEDEFEGPDGSLLVGVGCYTVTLGYDYDGLVRVLTCHFNGLRFGGYLMPRAEIIRSVGLEQIDKSEDIASERAQVMYDAGELKEVA